MGQLPDHFLLRTFSHYPIKILNPNYAPVNLRWNRLVGSPCLWEQLDVKISCWEDFDLSLKSKLVEVADVVKRIRLKVNRPLLGDVISSLCELPNLTELDLSHNHGLDKGMVSGIVAKCPTVEAANLSYCYPVFLN